MTVQTTETFNTFTGDGIQTIFTFTFACYETFWVVVFENDTRIEDAAIVLFCKEAEQMNLAEVHCSKTDASPRVWSSCQ